MSLFVYHMLLTLRSGCSLAIGVEAPTLTERNHIDSACVSDVGAGRQQPVNNKQATSNKVQYLINYEQYKV